MHVNNEWRLQKAKAESRTSTGKRRWWPWLLSFLHRTRAC